MPELEALLRDARPEWPDPSAAAEARARAALGVGPAPRSPRGWLTRTARGRAARLLVPAALLVTAGAAVAATLISTGSSGTAAGPPASLDFGPPETVGGPVEGSGGEPAVAVDGGGTVTVAWARGGRVVVSTRRPGGAWSAPERLSNPAERATQPSVGADRAGAVTVTWRARTAGHLVTERFTLPSGAPAGSLSERWGERWAVRARTRPAGGAWRPAERLSDDTAAVRDLERPRLVVAPGGRAVAAWDEGGDVVARIRPRGGAWGPAVRVGGDAGEAVDVDLSGAPSGAAIATWSNRVGAGLDRHYVIRAAVLGDGGSWGPAAVVDGRAVNPPNATGALGSGGEAVTAWISEGGAGTETTAAVRSAGGEWSPPEVLERAPRMFGLPARATVDGSGRAVVVTGPRGTVVARAPGGTWAHSPLPPRRGRTFGMAALTDPSGAAVVLRMAPAGALVDRPGATARIARPSTAGAPAIAVGADGTTAVVWATSGRDSHVSAAVAEAPG